MYITIENVVLISSCEFCRRCERHLDPSISLGKSLQMPIIGNVIFWETMKTSAYSICNQGTEYDEWFWKTVILDTKLSKISRFLKYPYFSYYLEHTLFVQWRSRPHHELLRGKKIEKFGNPVPVIDENNKQHYMHGNDPEQKYLPSRLLNGLL